MKKEQIEKIRIAVAEELGWKWVNHPDCLGCSCWGWSMNGDFHNDDYYRSEKNEVAVNKIPKYTASLDACVEFESTSDEDYWHVLLQVCDPDRHWSDAISSLAFMRATPLQRCITFLKTRNIEIPE